MIFLDTNIILRFVLQDHPVYSPKARAIFNKIDREEVEVYTSWLAIFEVVFVLQHTHKLPKAEISEKLLPILLLNNLKIENKNLTRPTFESYVAKNVSLADAYHAALMNKKGIKQIYSFDKDFDKFKNIIRKKIP